MKADILDRFSYQSNCNFLGNTSVQLHNIREASLSANQQLLNGGRFLNLDRKLFRNTMDVLGMQSSSFTAIRKQVLKVKAKFFSERNGSFGIRSGIFSIMKSPHSVVFPPSLHHHAPPLTSIHFDKQYLFSIASTEISG